MTGAPLHPLEEEALRRVRVNLAGAIRRYERVPRRRWRRFTALGVGVAGAVVASLVAFALVDGSPRDAQVDTVRGEPAPTTIVVTAPTRTPSTTSTTAPPPGPLPTDAVAVTVDGRLIVADVATGTELRELARRGDPRAAVGEGAPSVISGVTVDRANGLVYYETCCEPAVGSVFVVPLDGGESTRVADFSWPALSADGRILAGLGGDSLQLIALPDSGWVGGRDRSLVFHTSISADGTRIAYERGQGELVVVDTEDLATASASQDEQLAVLDHARSWQDPEGVGWMFPVFNREGDLVVAQQCCYASPQEPGPRAARVVAADTGEVLGSFQYPAPVADQEYDVSGTWLLVTLTDGRLVWFGGGTTGTVTGAYLAADW
jgi:hypothetical protein